MTLKTEIPLPPLNLQEGFASYRRQAGVVARALCRACRDIEFLRRRMGEAERQVEGLFESMLAESFS